jgi:hypothetical protein
MFTLNSHGGPESQQEQTSTGPLDGELLDLYAAILIVVPLALFLKSFLF